MIELNLQTNNKQEELVKEFLQNNASEALADKINNGTPFVKDGKPLINKKTLSGFMKYACEEARKQAEKGATSACIDSDTVFGWAIHYFEEDSIEGQLYMIDGTEYKPEPKVKPVTNYQPPVIKKPEEPKNKQLSFFDVTEDQPSEVKEEQPQKKGNLLYQQYVELQSKYPDSIVAYRVGDFYEVFGENAKVASNLLYLTLTSRDCGLDERVPMIGFPYHVSDRYIAKLVDSGLKVVIAETMKDILKLNKNEEEEEPEELTEKEMQEFDGDIIEPSEILNDEDNNKNSYLLKVIIETFDNSLIVR